MEKQSFFSSLLHSPQQYQSNQGFYNMDLQLNSLATETQTSRGVFIVLVDSL